MDDEFEILAAKVLAGEASAPEQARLREMLAGSPRLQEEFDGLTAVWMTIHEASPIADALDDSSPAIPAARLSELQEGVRKAFGTAPSRDAGNVEPARRPERPAPDPFPFWRWLFSPSGLLRLIASMAALAVISLVAGPFLRPNPPVELSDVAPVAYCVAEKGHPEVRHGRKSIPAHLQTIRAGDEVHLPAGSQINLDTSNGAAILRGPQSISGGAWAARSGVLPPVSNVISAALRKALFTSTDQLPAAGLLIAMRAAKAIPVYSPNGATESLTPPILWKAETGKTYDLHITDEFDPKAVPWIALGVKSPLEFSQVEGWKGRALGTNGLYRLRVNETGQTLTACEYTFRTLGGLEDPPVRTPAERLWLAFTIMSTAPARVGDALAVILGLPAEFAGSELALRLKLAAFGQLGYAEEFEATTAQLAR